MNLNEQLPRDLYKAYTTCNAYASQNRPSINHFEDFEAIERSGSPSIKYGNATYEVISADEALRYVKENKSNIENLRILIKNVRGDISLVEYEVRNNGSVYAIYGDSSYSVDVENSDKKYKNIRYVPWKTVIKNAYKIYKTNEYEITSNDSSTGFKNLSMSRIDRLPDTLDPTDDPHKPFAKMTKNPMYVNIDQINATHPNKRLSINMRTSGYRHNNLSLRDKQFSDVDRLGNDADGTKPLDTVDRLLTLKSTYDKALRDYTIARKALKALERDKDLYDDDEYESRKSRLNQIVNYELDECRQAAVAYRSTKQIITGYFDDKSIEVNQKIKNYVAKSEKLTTDMYNDIQKIQDIKNRPYFAKLMYSRKRNLLDLAKEISDKYNDIKKRISEINRELNYQISENDLDNIVDIIDKLDINDSSYDEIKNKLNEISTIYNEWKSKLSELNISRKDLMDKANDRLAQLIDEYNNLEDEYKQLKPKYAAAKAAKAAKNKEPELDKNLDNIVDFTED